MYLRLSRNSQAIYQLENYVKICFLGDDVIVTVCRTYYACQWWGELSWSLNVRLIVISSRTLSTVNRQENYPLESIDSSRFWVIHIDLCEPMELSWSVMFRMRYTLSSSEFYQPKKIVEIGNWTQTVVKRPLYVQLILYIIMHVYRGIVFY